MADEHLSRIALHWRWRWRSLRRTLTMLRQPELLKADSPRGVWEVTEEGRRALQFVAAESANYFDLEDPVSLAEAGAEAQAQHWLRGGFPLAFLASSDEASAAWRKSFAQTFLERDLPQFGISGGRGGSAVDPWAWIGRYGVSRAPGPLPVAGAGGC